VRAEPEHSLENSTARGTVHRTRRAAKGHCTPHAEAGENKGMLGRAATRKEGNIREHAPSHIRTLGGQRATKHSKAAWNETAESASRKIKQYFFHIMKQNNLKENFKNKLLI
jgi:hypothetical protein